MHINAVLHALNRAGKGVGARQFWSFRTGRRYAGVFWYNHMHAAHGSSQVDKAALVGWHAMDVMITDGCTQVALDWWSFFASRALDSAVFVTFVVYKRSTSVFG